jgi:hypothetical protein
MNVSRRGGLIQGAGIHVYKTRNLKTCTHNQISVG